MALPSERLQEGDERMLVGIAQPRLSLAGREIVGSEVVTLVDHVVCALGGLEQVRHEWREYFARLIVARTFRQRIQLVLDLQQQNENFARPREVDIR